MVHATDKSTAYSKLLKHIYCLVYVAARIWIRKNAIGAEERDKEKETPVEVDAMLEYFKQILTYLWRDSAPAFSKLEGLVLSPFCRHCNSEMSQLNYDKLSASVMVGRNDKMYAQLSFSLTTC